MKNQLDSDDPLGPEAFVPSMQRLRVSDLLRVRRLIARKLALIDEELIDRGVPSAAILARAPEQHEQPPC